MIFVKCSSSQISMPRDCAFVCFDPQFSPAINTLVDFDTEFVTIPPLFSINVVACCRVIDDNVPVNTNVLPLNFSFVCIVSVCWHRTSSSFRSDISC